MEGIHFQSRRKKLPPNAEWVTTFCLLTALRGNLLPQAASKKKKKNPKKNKKEKKKGHLDYKMESVNKRHFQGTTFNCWETIHYSTSTIRVIYRGGGGTGERLTLLPVSQMAQTSYVCLIKSFFCLFSANCAEGLSSLQLQVSQHNLAGLHPTPD